MHPRMTQLNVIHEVGDSQDESTDDDTASPTTDIPVEQGEGNADTESLCFSRDTLWYNQNYYSHKNCQHHVSGPGTDSSLEL